MYLTPKKHNHKSHISCLLTLSAVWNKGNVILYLISESETCQKDVFKFAFKDHFFRDNECDGFFFFTVMTDSLCFCLRYILL